MTYEVLFVNQSCEYTGPEKKGLDAGNLSTPVKVDLSDNPRQFYLRKIVGLSHDPFAGPVAEQELHSTEKEPHFFAYYTDPTPPQFDKPLLQALREARNGLIFGPPGSGKTTLRYTLEAECRAIYDRTLVVTYELSHKINRPPAARQHWTNLARELAVDLFIQIIEQLDLLDPPTELAQQLLQRQMALVWSRLRRTVDLILSGDYANRENGLASLWPRLNRPAVRYISPSPRINRLLEQCRPEGVMLTETLSGEAALRAGLAAAKAWGFKRVFVLVDGVDALERRVENMLALIDPLLANLTEWPAEGLYFYFFLPSELEEVLVKRYGQFFNLLTFAPIWYIIGWNKHKLSQLLQQRLWAAGSRLPGFNALAVPGLEAHLEEAMVTAANASPRRLLQVTSALIDAHAQATPDRLLITLDDWQQMQQQWSYDPPPPANLPINGHSP